VPRIDLGRIIDWISWSAVALQFLTTAVTARSALGRRRCRNSDASQPAMHSVPRLLLPCRSTRPDLQADSSTSGSVNSYVVTVRLTLQCQIATDRQHPIPTRATIGSRGRT
jgi:hypothetical protein